ncbi:MAG: hypothetical protein ABL895_10535 [Cyclobacteriaceae bacterium]
MKSRITFLSILSALVTFVAGAQNVEHDDMYFRSKDRVVLAASKPLKMQVPSKDMEVISTINPTDSYSARNVNPEYLSQSKISPSASNEPVSYFVPNYTPTSVNQNISSNSGYSNYANANCNCSALYNPYSSYYGGMSGFGSPYNSFYSPYGYGSPYGYNSFYGSGWSTALSMTWGLGAYNPWGSSYYGMNSWGMGMNYGYGGYYGNSGWYQPPVVIIGGGDSNGSGVVYGKRSSRSNDLNNNVTSSNRSTGTIDTQGRSRGSSGRIANNDNITSGSYYQRGWRTNPETNPSHSTWSNSGRSMNNGSAINGRSNSGSFFNDSGSRSSNWSSGNSSFSSGGGSRSSGGTSSGGSSGGARRGRD